MKNLFFRKFLIAMVLVGIVIAGGFYFFNQRQSENATYSQKNDIYYCPMHPDYQSNRPGTCPICHMNLVKKAPSQKDSAEHQHGQGIKELTIEELMEMEPGEICLLHKCKMGNCMIKMTPEIARQGRCPHCGEDLGVVVKEVMPEGYAPVSLSAEKQKMIGVTTALAQKKSLTKIIRAVGTVAKDPDLYQAQAEYIQASQSLNRAKAGGIDEVIEQAERLVSATKIRLNAMGLSSSLIKEIEGQSEPDSSLLFARADQPAWVYAKIYEYELPLVHVDQEVRVDLAALPGADLQGEVRAIDPVVDPATRTTRIRIKLKEANASLRPDMYVNVHIQIDLGEVLTVPTEAVFDTGNRAVVFVEKSNGNYEPREVVVGQKTENDYEIKQGVHEKEKVVVSGNFLIDSESRLQSSLSASSSGGHQHGA